MSRRVAVALSVFLAMAFMAAPAAAGTVIRFSDNMESGSGGWTATGFWNLVNAPQNIPVFNWNGPTAECPTNDINPDLVTLPDTDLNGQAFLPFAFSGTHAWWYGSAQNGTYIDAFFPNGVFEGCKGGGISTGANGGTLTSSSIDLTDLTSSTLRFKTWFEIESVDAPTFDQMRVEVSTDGGSTFVEIGKLNPSIDVNGAPDQPFTSGGFTLVSPYTFSPAVWVDQTFSLDAYVGLNIMIRFNFNSGDTLYNGFRGWLIDDVVVEGVGQQPTTTVLVSSANPSTFGQAVTFTATPAGAAGTPTGSVTFKDGAATLGTGTLDGAAHATLTTSSLAVGAHSITAEYGGDATFLGSSASLTQTVKATQTITLTAAAPATATYNTSFNVAATASSGLGVAITTTGVCSGGGTGSATITMTSGTGACTVTFSQAGDSTYDLAPSIQNVTTAQKAGQTITVTQAPCASGVHCVGADVAYNTVFTVAATASSGLPVAITTTGVCAGGGSGSATITLTSGTGSCVLHYNQAGDGNYGAAGEITDTIVAAKAATSLQLTSALNPSAIGQSVSFTATVTSAPGTPTGQVTFYDGVASLGSVNLSAGVAVFQVSTLSEGAHSISAVYAGDTNFSGSTSGTVAQTVNPSAAGAIRDTLGNPLAVAGAFIDFFRDTPAHPFVARFFTGPDGTYTTGGTLTPGTYFARVTLAGYISTFYTAPLSGLRGLDFTTASPITLGDSATGIDVTLVPGGTVMGVIKDRTTLDPVAGATVTASRVVGQSFSGTFTVQTDATGHFTIAGLRDGDWVVRATPPAANANLGIPSRILGYYSGDPDPAITSSAVDAASAKPIIISGAAAFISPIGSATCSVPTTCVPLTSADIYLTPGGGILQGHITTSAGSPVPLGTGVGVNGPAPRYLQTNPVTGVSTVLETVNGTPTNTGFYRFTGLPPGQYIVSAGPLPGTLMTWGAPAAATLSTAVPVSVSGGVTTTANVVLPVTTTRKIEGTLRDANGVSIPYGVVVAQDPFTTGGARFVSVRGDGTYTLDGLRPGRYLVRATLLDNPYQLMFVDGALVASQSTPVDVTDGDASGRDFAVPATGGVITGRITRTDSGQPMGGAALNVRNFFNGPAGLGATSRSDGTFQIRAVPPGSYKIRAVAPPSPTAPSGFAWRWFAGAGAGAAVLDDASFVIVNAGQTVSVVNIGLTPGGGTISGFTRRPGTLAPVEGAGIDARELLSGASVSILLSDVDGGYVVPGLPDGRYTIRFTGEGSATQWLNGQDTRESADVFTISGGALEPDPPVLDALLSTVQGTVSGRIFKTDGTPLANAGVSFYDAASFAFVEGDPTLGTRDHLAGFVSGAGVTDAQGRYRQLSGLKPGTYIAQARALDYDTTQGSPVGYAPVFFGQVPSASAAPGFVVTVTAPNDPSAPPVDFTLPRSSDIRGTVAYAGSQSGPLRVVLFCDAALTQGILRVVVPSPSFAPSQAYSFETPAPETRGLMPSANACPQTGTYFVDAYIDVNGNKVDDAGEPTGRLGGSSSTPVTVTEGQAVNVGAITLGENLNVAGTTSGALGVFQIVVPSNGTTGTLGDIEIDENGAAVLSTAGRITLTLPTGLTFATMPQVSTGVGWGLSVVQSGPSGPRLENFVTNQWVPESAGEPGQRFSFALTGPAPAFRGGAANIFVSSMLLRVPAGFVAENAPEMPVLVAVGSTAANGLTAATVQNGTLLAPGLTFTGIAPATNAAAEGVTRTVVLNGDKFTQLDFTNLDPSLRAAIFFGFDLNTPDPGIHVTGVSVDSDTQITVTIQVDLNAPVGNRVVAIVNTPGGTLTATMQGGGVFSVDAVPTVTSAGTATEAGVGTGPVFTGVKNQTIYVLGTSFRAPTTSPSNLTVQFSGNGITINNVAFNSPERIDVNVDVAPACGPTVPPCADLVERTVTVTNPDLGVATSGSILTVASPPPDAPQTLNASKVSGASTPVAAPSLTAITPAAAVTGTSVSITGSNFASPLTVTFTAANNGKVTATPATSGATSLTVVVPGQAVDGPVTVTAGTLASTNAVSFTVNNPRLEGLSPASGVLGSTVTLGLTGAKFASGATVSIAGVTASPVTATFVSATQLQVTVTVPSSAATGLHDVSVTNPNTTGISPAPGGLTSTLSQAFEAKVNTPLTLTLTLTDTKTGAPIDAASYLPSVDGVNVTLDGTGKCTAKAVQPTSVILTATVTGTTLPTSMTFTITPSAIPGTATNEDCEIDPATNLPTSTPTNDFTIGAVGLLPSLTAPLSLTVLGNGTYQAQLSSWDWGGKVRVDVVDNTGTLRASLSVPADDDHDDLPNVYENNQLVDNGNAAGVNVLDATKSDQNGNGVLDRNDRFALDGLTNFEKYRGIWLQGPVNGAILAPLARHQRLGAGMRNLFVRGRGFSLDPAIAAAGTGYCGLDGTGAPFLDTSGFLTTFPCPAFQVGDAFRAIGVKVWNVAPSFTPGAVFPTKSYVDATRATLDMLTVTLNAVDCNGGEDCTHTGKTGSRQWQFPTLGISSFGSSTAYGQSFLFLRAFKAYFMDRPYLHQENLAGKFLPVVNTGVPMLAPITMACDNVSGGSDNGVPNTGECVVSTTVNGTTTTSLGGDVYTPGVYGQPSAVINGVTMNPGVTAMDVNNDNCVELPFVSDPTTLTPCAAGAASATYPQATFQQVIRSVVTHEMGHGTGVNTHTSDSTDIMYIYSTDWIRDSHFGTQATSLIQIHNKGLK